MYCCVTDLDLPRVNLPLPSHSVGTSHLDFSFSRQEVKLIIRINALVSGLVQVNSFYRAGNKNNNLSQSTGYPRQTKCNPRRAIFNVCVDRIVLGIKTALHTQENSVPA